MTSRKDGPLDGHTSHHYSRSRSRASPLEATLGRLNLHHSRSGSGRDRGASEFPSARSHRSHHSDHKPSSLHPSQGIPSHHGSSRHGGGGGGDSHGGSPLARKMMVPPSSSSSSHHHSSAHPPPPPPGSQTRALAHISPDQRSMLRNSLGVRTHPAQPSKLSHSVRSLSHHHSHQQLSGGGSGALTRPYHTGSAPWQTSRLPCGGPPYDHLNTQLFARKGNRACQWHHAGWRCGRNNGQAYCRSRLHPGEDVVKWIAPGIYKDPDGRVFESKNFPSPLTTKKRREETGQ